MLSVEAGEGIVVGRGVARQYGDYDVSEKKAAPRKAAFPSGASHLPERVDSSPTRTREGPL